MSVVKILESKSVGAATVYAVYGTHENMRNDDVRAAAYSVVSATPDATPMQFVSDTVAEHARHPKRENQAVLVIQSFHPEELDKDDAFDVHLAHLAGLELARRIAPNSDVVVATHTDSDSGHLHNHLTFANHDRVTGNTPRDVRYFHKVKHFNDEVMKDLGLEVYEPEPIPGRPPGYSHLKNSPLPEITKDNWREEMTHRVDAVLADPRVAAAATVSDGLEVVQDIAADYNVSFRVTTHKKEKGDVTATTYALVDDDDEVIRYATARGSRSTKRTGSRLGKGVYDLESVSDRISDLQEQYQQQQHQRILQQGQIRQQRTSNILKGDENGTSQEEKDPGSTAQPLKERFKDVLADLADPSDSASDPAGDSPSAAAGAVLYGSGREGIEGDDGEGKGGRGQSSSGRVVSVSDSIREGGSRAGGDVEEVRESPSASGGVERRDESSDTEARPAGYGESTSSGGSSADKSTKSAEGFGQGEWQPDKSTEGLRQVDFDFLEQRVMDDEYRQFQRSQFDGTDKQYFEHLLGDDDVLAAEYENYAHARTRLFDPVGDQREWMKRTVGENQRRVAAARRQRQNRLQQQQQQEHQQQQEGDRDGGD